MNSKWKKISFVSALVALVSLSIAAILFFTTGIVALGERKSVTINEERSFDLEGVEAIDLGTISTNVRVGTSASGKIEARLSGTVATNYPEKAIPTMESETRGRELKIWMSTTSGEVRARGLKTKEAEFSSVSGDIKVKDFEGDVALRTTSGEIAIDYSRFDNTVRISSTSGDVRLGLSKMVEFRLSVRTTSGDIDCDFPITMTGSGAGRCSLEGTVGSGSNAITIKTVSRGIDIKS